MDASSFPTLFQRVLGPAFAQLPPVVRALHRGGDATYEGRAVVRRGSGWLSRLCAWAARLPPAYDGPITVSIQSSRAGETWVRRFGSHRMPSRLYLDGALLGERLGLLRFRFRLTVLDACLVWSVEQVRLLLLPLPRRLFRGVAATESVQGGRYTFDVAARLPVVGLLVHYRGWLDVA